MTLLWSFGTLIFVTILCYQTGFGVRGLTRKEIRRLQVKHEMYITSTKNIANYNDKAGPMAISRSFSGPIVLQNIGTNMLTPDMVNF